MPEPLKNIYSQSFLTELGEKVNAFDTSVTPSKFVRDTTSKDWKQLELKDRMARISTTLHKHLGGDFAANAQNLSAVAQAYRQEGKSGFEYMFLPNYIERYGREDFAGSMKALAAMTETGSAEFAIRAFLIEQPIKTLKHMTQWSKSRNEHLRRLSSEGCRPRLPWAMSLPEFKKDPEPILPILERLKADPSLYVRRSVANNLNDISKDHPDLALDLGHAWHGVNEDTNWLVKHALRGLLKAGHPRALELFGLSPPKHLTIENIEIAKEVVFGNSLSFSFDLASKKQLGKLRLEYGIDLLKANGSHSRKVFKISESIATERTRSVSKTHKFVPISTRVYHPGVHHLAIIVNGVELHKQAFELIMA